MKPLLTILKQIPILIILSLLAMEAQAQNEIKRKELLNTAIGSRTISDVKIVEIDFPAGQKAPYHKHPCPVLGSIVSGTCLIQVEGKPAQILKAGDAFYEPADTPIVHFDNYSDSEPMKFIAYYLLNDQKALIELLPEKSKE